MIRRLIEQQNIGRRNDRLCDRKPLAPASAECCSYHADICQADPATRLTKLSLSLSLGHMTECESSLKNLSYRFPRSERRLLANIPDTGTLADRNVACIRILLT